MFLTKQLKMKKTLMILTMLLGIATVGFAQNSENKNGTERKAMKPEDRAKRMAENLETKLKLNADQKTKIYEVSLEQSKKMDSLRKTSGEMKTKFPQMKTIMEASDAKIDKILNEDQRKAYTSLKEERRKNRGQKKD